MMTTIKSSSINAIRKKYFKATAALINDIARQANDYQAQELSRTQALQLAEFRHHEGYKPDLAISVEQAAAFGFKQVEIKDTEAAEEAPALRE